MRRLGILFLLCFALSPARAAETAPPRFVVFFQEWSANLDPAAQTVITHASDYAKAHPGAVLHVNGFADPTGSRKANALLTDLRAQMVMDQLQSDGVQPAHIHGRGRGAVQYALSSQESRRVEISLSGR
jgi:outer membrane protein OmpA-like peptidoglycan-associated protein